ncbi:capsular biosynthesis protein [Granulosicoccus antarcticus]|uniref:Capsular biosynthesis protein n=1 Tax=Granulosicoccus antarcticus IMCC3135 TaxID=1192854 RepID=A0A2Z2NSD7_9GAMM|nr:capsular biosynthesis protein [Granulosicoccus antarcticus]ASJ71650.1 hypothetical protein IMCC3135_07725 [Granulosicoccus antarcticus IMCC3135]
MIVIPMAGLSSRFKNEGFETQKYMLEARGQTLFDHSLMSFERYFGSERFLFITLEEHKSESFIRTRCHEMGITCYDVVQLTEQTLGQAHTVYLGIKAVSVCVDEPILVFNIDTFRPNFKMPKKFDVSAVDGYLETFIGSGKNWSNVLPRSTIDMTVKRTAEKQEISEYCCTGIYYFRSAELFTSSFERSATLDNNDCELYIAPLYNRLIEDGMDIRYTVILREEVIFCGVPEEYYQFAGGK